MTLQGRNKPRRGQPLFALAAILAGWVTLRMAFFVPPGMPFIPIPRTPLARILRAQTGDKTFSADAVTRAENLRVSHVVQALPPLHASPPPAPCASVVVPRPVSFSSPAGTVPLGFSDMVLWRAMMHAMPIEISLLAAISDVSTEGAPDPAPSPIDTQPAVQTRRWSGDAWLFVRPTGMTLAGTGGVGPSYGASQAGAVLRYDLANTGGLHPQVYLRAASALAALAASRDAGLGLSVKPLAQLPFRAYSEGRLIQSGDRLKMRAVAFLAGGIEHPLAGMDGKIHVSGYAEGGLVAGETGFAAGQLVLDRGIGPSETAPIRAGAGAWGGVQRGAGRLDVGPTASLRLRVGGLSGRVSADYRLRVAGNAEPSSGAALTLSAGF